MLKILKILSLYSLKEPDESTLRQFALFQAKTIQKSADKLSRTNRNFFIKDSRQIYLGDGPEVFQEALKKVCQLEMFNLPPIGKAYCQDRPLQIKSVVVVVAQALNIWIRIASYVSEIINEQTGQQHVAGFAYTTLSGHIMFGKEWFKVAHHFQSNKVYFQLSSISRPGSIWLLPMFPIIRFYQLKFQKLALRAVLETTVPLDQ